MLCLAVHGEGKERLSMFMTKVKTPRRSAFTASSLLIASVALASCGSSALSSSSGSKSTASGSSSSPSQSVSPKSIVLASYTKTLGAKSFDVNLVESISISGHASENVSLSGSESVGSGSPVAEFVTTLPAPLNGKVDAILVGGTEYIGAPPTLSAALPPGIKWLSINVKQVATSFLGSNAANPLSGATADPASILSFVKNLSGGGLTKVATATIDGVPTTEYSGSLNVAGILAKSASTTALAKLESVLGTKPIPIEVWVDSSGLLRQMTMSMSLSGPGLPTSAQATVAIQLNLSNFGVAVNVTAPPASETMPISKALG